MPALQSDTAYPGPTQEDLSAEPNLDSCICNGVYYSMLSACGACQGGSWIKYVSRRYYLVFFSQLLARHFCMDITDGLITMETVLLSSIPACKFLPGAEFYPPSSSLSHKLMFAAVAGQDPFPVT